MMKGKKRREKIAKKNSQFNPKTHELGRQGFGFQMKKGYKPTKDELSGKNLPFKTDDH